MRPLPATPLSAVRLSLFTIAASLLGVAALAGCGGGSDPTAEQAHAARPGALVHGQRGYFDQPELELRMSNAFRAGLYRLAVMTQPGEEAADAGQQLPTGKVFTVSCDPLSSAPASGRDWPWRCEVRWQTVEGGARRTRYAVQLTPRSCFAAEAQPQLAPILDSTTGAASEHPLNTFGRQLGKC